MIAEATFKLGDLCFENLDHWFDLVYDGIKAGQVNFTANWTPTSFLIDKTTNLEDIGVDSGATHSSGAYS